jgi:hypothetical protein
MTERSQAFMNAIWEARNAGADTEEKLVAVILRLATENVRAYNAQNDLIVLDKQDMIELSNEIKNLSK